MVCALVCLITPLFDTTVCCAQHAVVFLAPIAEKVFIKCRKRQKKFAELKSCVSLQPVWEIGTDFLADIKFLDNIEREENIMFSIDNEVK